MTRFSCVKAALPVEVFAISEAYRADTFSQKVDLGIGAYRTEEDKPWLLSAARKPDKKAAEDAAPNDDCIDPLGSAEFTKAAVRVLLGDDNAAIKQGRAVGVQCLGGTGSMRIGAELMCKHGTFTTVYLSSISWSNHAAVFRLSGFENIKCYRYWDATNRCLDFTGMIEDLRNADKDSVVLLQVCGHNPTGVDPTQDQWKKIADVMKDNNLFPYFDCAYQGFASGNLKKDSWAVRYFAALGFELFCAQSFCKTFGLYNDRIGNLLIVINEKAALSNVLSQIRSLVRGHYLHPPYRGTHIVTTVLNTPEYFEEWKSHIKMMAKRIIEMRKALRDKLVELGTPGSWKHITEQKGMFSYTGLSQQQVQLLVQEHHVYLPMDGRISISGLNTSNVEYVAKAIRDAVLKSV